MLREGFDPRPGGRLRGVLVWPIAALHAFVHMFLLLLGCYLVPGFAGARAAPFVRLWGRIQLALFGIRCELVGFERLAEPGPRVVTFNHQSLLDLALIARAWPPDGCVLYKQEFHRVPIMGRLMRLMGMIPVDRKNRLAAIASLKEAARRVLSQQAKVFIAPEGTRSRTGKLAPFKRGPFHLAAETHAPLLPMVMHGVRELWPHDRWVPRTGRVRLEILPPVDTSSWTPEAVDAQIEQLRRVYLAALPDPELGPPPLTR